tara:strand:- start:294 stop:506 length:213 start_codon:yes stop_codon:yes gene_type:complete
MDVQDRLKLAHLSVCKAENERMREVFGIRNYKEGDQWTAQRNRQVTGAEGGRQKNLKRLWVKERTVQCKQ